MKRVLWQLLVVSVCAYVGSSFVRAQQAAPDVILINGKIITVDERFSIAQAVAVRGDRIVAVGANQDIGRLAGPNTRRIDLRGKALQAIDLVCDLFEAASVPPLAAAIAQVQRKSVDAIAELHGRIIGRAAAFRFGGGHSFPRRKAAIIAFSPSTFCTQNSRLVGHRRELT